MKTNKSLNKVFGVVLATSMTWAAIAAGSLVDAQSTSVFCQAFPCNGILGPNGTIDINSIITLVFRIILYAAVLWTVWNVVLAGLKIAGAKEDADKRKEGIQAVINAVIGLVVALLAFGIVATVTNTLNAGNVIELSGVPCTGHATGSTVYKAGFKSKDGTKCISSEDNKTELVN